MKTPKIYYVKSLPFSKRGMILPPIGILINKKYKGRKHVLAHFIIHWSQYKRMGLLLFLFRYIIQMLFLGKRDMPLELEAKLAEKNSVVFDFIFRRNYPPMKNVAKKLKL